MKEREKRLDVTNHFFLNSELIGFRGHLDEEEECTVEGQTETEEDFKVSSL